MTQRRGSRDFSFIIYTLPFRYRDIDDDNYS